MFVSVFSVLCELPDSLDHLSLLCDGQGYTQSLCIEDS